MRNSVHPEPGIRRKVDRGIAGCGGKGAVGGFRAGCYLPIGNCPGLFDPGPDSKLKSPPGLGRLVSPVFSHCLCVSQTRSLFIGDLSGSTVQSHARWPDFVRGKASDGH